MDSKSTSLDFAIIGHQESWQSITSFINGIRNASIEPLPVDKIKDVFGFMPPRDLFKITLKSKTGNEVNGVFIETFIDPDKLSARYLKTNISKVKKAISLASKLNAKLATLGGFTSIVLEGSRNEFKDISIKLTTGNTLTAGFILKGIEHACVQYDIRLEESNVLIIGATGDIGLACTHYLKQKVSTLLLNARNQRRLETLATSLRNEGVNVFCDTNLESLVPKADIIIAVASSKDILIGNTKNNVIICDAGYPKNLENRLLKKEDIILFHGGMGIINYGYTFSPNYKPFFYNYPVDNVAHGCVLEAVILAFEKKYENYSVGKGNITPEAISNIYQWALKHGVELAPFYNSKGLCKLFNTKV
ncbi:hypothetical protein [Aestuariibaculum sediminum]|uniref:Quinate/shikimate 5-dehydrogenase/glutamyl-tRNA reductase domain-containing protein n=1 Tax=Aestuariibaculum sediminum TaxID=2770637 RepID=A0A8J6PZH7_9FLAO|nr:hypothetical protein [Aestuariibaculum sediminum]MBD0831577.1 hypothetical protein [Aestuariibaculum sediminum]